MPNPKKVAILAAMHGEEVYGIELYEEFTRKHPHLASYIALVIGNKRAVAEYTRFIDIDMNRAYNNPTPVHETVEIERVTTELIEINPDYILDIHTTRRDSGVFFITDSLTPTKHTICELLDIDICVMKDEVINSSFIGNNSKAVSLEYSLKSISKQTTDQFVERLKQLIERGTLNADGYQRKVYDVQRLISKSEYKEYSSLKNRDVRAEGVALMVPKDASEMDAEYFGFWCKPVR